MKLSSLLEALLLCVVLLDTSNLPLLIEELLSVIEEEQSIN